MTKEFIDSIVKQLKEYVDAKLRGWGLSDEEKSLVAFEQKHMPYTQYSGNQSIDHVLFRKFLRLFDPENIRNNLANHKQDKYDEGLKTADKTVVGGINEVYDSVPPFAFFEQNEDGTYTIVLPHKSVYAPASESGLYIEVSLPNECFENTVALYYDLVMPLVSGVEANEDGEDTKTVTMYL